jgi:hypothetical protein
LKVRTALLAMLLLDLAAGATWYAGRYGSGRPDELRLFLVWALPGLVFLCGFLTRPKAPRIPGRAARRGGPLLPLPPAIPRLPVPSATAATAGTMAMPAPAAPGPRWSRLLLWIGVAVAVDLAPIAIGHRLGWLTFTYGDQHLAASRATTALWALPLLIVLAIRFYERTLRGQLYRGAEESWGSRAAWALTLLCGTALALPTIAPGFAWSEPSFVAAALVTALAREISCTVLYRASGLVAAGLLRGVFTFVDFYLIADWLAPVFPSANYVTSGDSFYLLRAASPLVAALLLVRFLPSRAKPVPRPSGDSAQMPAAGSP